MTPAGAPGPYATVKPGGRVAIVSDEVAKGKSLLTCGEGDFSGTVLRRGPRRFDVENEWGDPAGVAASWKAGAQVLARYHGYELGRFEHYEEWRLDQH